MNNAELHPQKPKIAIGKIIVYSMSAFIAVFCIWLIFGQPKSNEGRSINFIIKPLPNNINFLTVLDLQQITDTIIDKENFSKALCEQMLEQNPYIRRAEVYQDLSGKIKCIVTQRKPIARIINANQTHFYLDEDGKKIPVLSGMSARVLVANGYIGEKLLPSDTLKTKTLLAIYEISKFIESELFWKQFTEQLYVDKYNDICLIPKVGSFIIVVGNSDRIAEKFERLKVFITMVLPKVGWEKYQKISVKFKNQIVTTKKEE